MFSVIRIPTKFSKTIRRLSDKEKVQLFSLVMDIGDGVEINPPDSIVGDIISLIYGEWMNMESRNGNKPEESLIKYTSEGVGKDCPSDPGHRVEYSRVEESIIDTSKEVVPSTDPPDEKPYPPGGKTVPPSDEKSDDNTIIDKTIKIYSSKEESHDVVVSEKKEYGDKNINIIIETIKKNNNGIIDGTVQENRRFGKLLKDKIDKIIGFNGDYEWFIGNLIQNTDKYQISNTTSCEGIFYNLSKLIKKIQMSNNPEPRGVRTITV